MKKILIKKSQYKGLPLFPGRSPYVKAYLDDAVDMVNEATRGKKTIVSCKIEINIDHTEWKDILSDNGECIVRMISGIAENIEKFRAASACGNTGMDDYPIHAAWRFLYFQDMSSKYQMVLLIDPDAYFAQQAIHDPLSGLKEMAARSWAKANNIALASASQQILFAADCVKTFQCDSYGMQTLFPTIGMLCSDRENFDKVFVSMFGTSKLLDDSL